MQVISANNNYASGGKRLVAFFIDWLVLHAVFTLVFYHWWGSPLDWDSDYFNFRSMHWSLMFWGLNIIEAAITALYYAGMESSKYQATLGKLAVGIKVTTAFGAPVSFPKALLRNLSKYLSAFILYIGYIMIIFDDRKQGLHDKIADTLVVNQ